MAGVRRGSASGAGTPSGAPARLLDDLQAGQGEDAEQREDCDQAPPPQGPEPTRLRPPLCQPLGGMLVRDARSLAIDTW